MCAYVYACVHVCGCTLICGYEFERRRADGSKAHKQLDSHLLKLQIWLNSPDPLWPLVQEPEVESLWWGYLKRHHVSTPLLYIMGSYYSGIYQNTSVSSFLIRDNSMKY